MLKPSKFFMNEADASPGGAAPVVPAVPPATTAAPEAPKYVTSEQLSEQLQAFQNGFFANARKAGLLPKETKPETAPVAPAQAGQPENPMAVLALRDAFDDATSEMKLTKGQRSLLRDHVMTRRPATGDVDSMVGDFVSRAGWNPAPSITTTSVAPTTAAPAAPTAPAAPESPKPASAPSAPSGHGLPTQNGVVDLFSLTPQQLKDLGKSGFRQSLDSLNQIGNQMAGIPERPKPPSQR